MLRDVHDKTMIENQKRENMGEKGILT